MIKLHKCGLYAITDCENYSKTEILEKTEKILAAGAAMLQYRDKSNSPSDRKQIAIELSLLCKSYDTVFIINDDISLAKEAKADGVHLGERDENIRVARELLGDVIIGISCYNRLESALSAEKQGADYVALGTFYTSKTKPDARKADINLITITKSKIKLPIVAIGGITPENGKVLINAGADYLAVITGLYDPANTTMATNAYLDLFNIHH